MKKTPIQITIALSEYELDCLESVIKNASPRTKAERERAMVASVAVDCFKTALHPSLRHKHRCKKCRTVWEHPDMTLALGDTVTEATHTCPKCGQQETNYYTGSGKPHFKQLLTTTVKTQKCPGER